MRKTTRDTEEPFAQHVVTYPQGVNLRAGPGTDQPVLRVLKAGETVIQTGVAVEHGWMPVEGGWVDCRYVREV